jgi:putative ABC transport system permease protein
LPLQTLFGSGTAIGQTVRAGSKVLREVGVLNLKGGGGLGSVDDQALVPITVVQQLYGARTPDGNGWKVSQIQISVTNRADITTVQARIQALLRQRHSLAIDGTKDDFQVQNQASLLSSLTMVTTLLTYFLASVACTSLLVGGIGIMNI